MPLEQPEPSSMDLPSGIRRPNTIPAWPERHNLNKLCLRCSKISLSSLQPTDYEHLASVQVSHAPLRLGTLRETAHAGCHLCCLVLVGLEAKFLEEDAYMKTRNIMYGPESKPTYGDEAKIKIEASLPNKYYRGQLPSHVSVSLDPTQVRKTTREWSKQR
jgi:hypothetical protein